MPSKVRLDNIAIVLHQPRYPENIGAAARAMLNMGIEHLVVVDPQNYDLEKVLKLATHVAIDIVKNIHFHTTLKEALSPYHYVVGTTARLGGQRQLTISPSKIAEKLVKLSAENRIAILFGPEDKGLSNEDIRFCHELATIPASDFSSLNLAQAVMIMCYEIFNAACQETEAFIPRLANRHELDGMYEQLKDVLVKISFINPENPDFWMNRIRHFFTRLKLQAKEVSIIRGICRQINWYGRNCYEKGLKTGQDSSSPRNEQ
ncbi:MAG: RNA methyltransferase [Proteobacteria bacterium]|nr:RNA methyltransferase [Pseudomonadota bacterium]